MNELEFYDDPRQVPHEVEVCPVCAELGWRWVYAEPDGSSWHLSAPLVHRLTCTRYERSNDPWSPEVTA